MSKTFTKNLSSCFEIEWDIFILDPSNYNENKKIKSLFIDKKYELTITIENLYGKMFLTFTQEGNIKIPSISYYLKMLHNELFVKDVRSFSFKNLNCDNLNLDSLRMNIDNFFISNSKIKFGKIGTNSINLVKIKNENEEQFEQIIKIFSGIKCGNILVDSCEINVSTLFYLTSRKHEIKNSIFRNMAEISCYSHYFNKNNEFFSDDLEFDFDDLEMF